MDLASNPQTLTLISCPPLSSTSLCSVRRTFLGSSRHLRSPPAGLRAKRSGTKLGFLQVQPPRFRFRAALSSHSVLVIGAVVTFSAISVVYFNHYQKRKKNVKELNWLHFVVSAAVIFSSISVVYFTHYQYWKKIVKEVSGRHHFALSHLGKDFVDRVIEIWIQGLGDLNKNFVKEGEALIDTTRTHSNSSENKDAAVHVNISTAMHEETHINKVVDSSNSDVLPSSSSDSLFSHSNLMHKETLMTKPVDSVDSNILPSSATLVHEEILVTETEDLASSYVIPSSASDSIYSTSTLMNEETIITKRVDSTGSDASDSIISNGFQVTDPSFSPATSESGASQSLIFPGEISDLQLDECKDESNFKSELEKLMTESNCTVLNTALVEGNEHSKANNELDGEVNTMNRNGFHTESVKKELYTFYEAEQPETKSMANLNGLKPSSSHAVLEVNGFSSMVRDTLIESTELSVQDSPHIADSVNGKIPPAYRKEGSSTQKRELKNSRGFLRGKENSTLPQSYYPDRTRIIDIDDPSKKSSTYDRFLRNRRLTDCVELLEGLERMGLLDMSKLYHGRFFQTCKSEKAVKEAFRFTKLIPNPTLSTFNMLMSVCASSQDSNGAFRVLELVQEAGLKADCKLYTTLISSCARSGKVDAMFEVFHKMVNAGVQPNVNTYGALIDGCAKAGQVAKAFGAYGIMRSKNVKPDRVVFNALITACGQSGAVDRAFDVLADMKVDDAHPIDPDHVTVGALIKACANAGKFDRAKEVYKLIHKYNIKGTPEVYTIAVNCCSPTGDWEFACNVYGDLKKNGIVPDEMFLSALVDSAGHARKVEAAFEILQEARTQGIQLGIISYSSLMGACCNGKNWQKALELYEYIKSIKLKATVSTMNALITALCDGDQLDKAMDALSEMKRYNLRPNNITYSILLVASEKKDDLDSGLLLFSQAKQDGIPPDFVMCRRIVGMCLRRFEKAYALGEPVLSFISGRPQIDNKWTSLALSAYCETVATGAKPTLDVVSQVLGCLQLPCDSSLKTRIIENLGLDAEVSRYHKLCSLIDGFGEYDPCAFSLYEEAASLRVVPSVSFERDPITIDVRKLEIHTAKVIILTVLKGLKHRLAAGARLPNITIVLPTETRKFYSAGGQKTINVAGRISLAVAALLRRISLPYQGNGSSGKIFITGLSVRRWLQPQLTSPFTGKPVELIASQSRLGKRIVDQQRDIRTRDLSWE